MLNSRNNSNLEASTLVQQMGPTRQWLIIFSFTVSSLMHLSSIPPNTFLSLSLCTSSRDMLELRPGAVAPAARGTGERELQPRANRASGVAERPRLSSCGVEE